ncbi:sodium:proton antiporter [Alkalihalophilus lindianensis]|uniref:Sodium:proton antiporter n=1 Tax=Alkalihalophilus lindianensis TaxID=1630542 RepID=A0ABU3X5K6_9BACI|nr:sodium:proton antiporter [Alkalihalophilus lindianensis]MDV2683183.1 sodium:proton antiporter [Alkalihalophilus lindianensis]
MVNRLFSIATLILSFYFAYKYRYRVINAILGRRWLRKIGISIAMQIPMIRDRVLSTVLQPNRPQNS